MAIESAKLRPNPFACDDGELQPALAAAFAEPLEKRISAIVGALDRVIVPVVPHAHPGRDALGGARRHESVPTNSIGSTDEDLVKTAFPGGRQSLAIFSSAQACSTWNPDARPVPAHIKNVAVEALKNEVAQLTLDPGLATQTWLGRSAVMALASGTGWQAPWEDERIRSSILDEVGALPGLVNLTLAPAAHGATAVVVDIDESTTKEEAMNVIHGVIATLGSHDYVKARLDAVEIQPRPAGE